MNAEAALEPAVRALQSLSPRGREIAVSLIRQLAEREGISVPLSSAQGLQAPVEGLPLWVARLRAERYSERTVHMYPYLVRRYLERDPVPTKLRVQSYLAERLEQVSPACVSNERKALASFFGFLHEEGLWHTNPLNGIKHVRVRYREKQCPSMGDVLKVLNSKCLRKKDTDKLRVLVLLLVTTGIRISEAVGITKADINPDALELRVVGKGDKVRVVPLLPVTADTLIRYAEERPGGSPHLFPGSTRSGHADIHNVEKTLRRACLRAGIEPFTPHQLRHFYATYMLKSGAKLEVVARILGHAGVGVTADIYRHVDTGELHSEHARFAPLNSTKMLT